MTLSAQKVELAQLRQRRDDVEAVRNEMDASERDWADKCRQAEVQVDRLRADLRFVSSSSSPCDPVLIHLSTLFCADVCNVLFLACMTSSAITSSLPVATDPAETTALHAQLRTALSLHQEALSTLSAKETELVDLHSRLETLSQSSRGALSTYAKKIDDLERELRLSEEGRKNATTKLELIELELKGERKRLEKEFAAAAAAGGLGADAGGGADQSRRVQELEGLVSAYKERLGKMELDSREAEEKIAQGLGYVKRSEADELKRQVEGLNRGKTSLLASPLAAGARLFAVKADTPHFFLHFLAPQKSPPSLPSPPPTPPSPPRSKP